jgi:ABC-type glycerol-3-phosphate transport system substrate-binding protein
MPSRVLEEACDMHDSPRRSVAGRRSVRALAGVLGFALVAAACTATPATSPATAPSGDTAACNPPNFPSGEISITAWTGTDTTAQELGRELVSEYQALHPNVKIDNIPTGTTEGLPKMLVALPAGEPDPTVAVMYEPYIEIFRGPGYLEPVIPEAVCAADQQEVIDRYVAGSIDPLIVDGTISLLPVQRNAYSLLVNNDKFTEAGLSLETDIPTTWDEMAAIQDQLKKTDANGRTTQKGYEFRYTSGDQWFSSQFIGMVYQEGGSVVDDQGNVVLNTPEALAALENWTNNVVDPSVTNNAPPSPYQDFADELDVMAFGGPNALKFAEILNPDLKGRVTVAPLPRGSASDVSGMAYGFHYGVNKNATADEKFVAWNFIDFVLADANRWWDRTGQLQPKKDLNMEGIAGLDVFVSDLEASQPLPLLDTYGVLQVAIKNAIQRVVFEDVDPEASLEQAQEEYDSQAN